MTDDTRKPVGSTAFLFSAKQFGYLTIAGGTLLLPLFTMVDRLLHVTAASTAAKANEQSAWSLSAISIAAIMLESWLVRAQ
jgi:hypothetical protein